MKQTCILIFLISFFNCKNDVYSDKEKFITTVDGNTNVLYKNSFENGVVKDSIAAWYYDQGIELSSILKYKKAKENFENANKLEPNNISIINVLGNVCAELKEFDESNNYFEKALSLDVEYWMTYLNYGFSRARNDEYEKAIELYSKGLSFQRNGKKRGYFYYNMSRAYYQLDEVEKAKKQINKAIELVNDEYLKKEVISFRNTVYEK